MNKKFDVILLDDALEFITNLDLKTRKKIYYNLDKAKLGLDPKLLKKLNNKIWEFRMTYKGLQYRFFAFWDKTNKTLVVSTHGIIKKFDKIPRVEILKAERIREEYFKN